MSAIFYKFGITSCVLLNFHKFNALWHISDWFCKSFQFGATQIKVISGVKFIIDIVYSLPLSIVHGPWVSMYVFDLIHAAYVFHETKNIYVQMLKFQWVPMFAGSAYFLIRNRDSGAEADGATV